MTSFLIRLADLKDVPLLEDIEHSAATLFREIKNYELSGRTVPTKLLRKMTIDQKLWVATNDDDLPVGFVCCRDMEDILYVHEISVARKVQRKGIGRRLMLTVLEKALLKKYVAVGLTTRRDAAWNMPFYKTLGFHEMMAAQECPALWHQLQHEIDTGASPTTRCAMLKIL